MTSSLLLCTLSPNPPSRPIMLDPAGAFSVLQCVLSILLTLWPCLLLCLWISFPYVLYRSCNFVAALLAFGYSSIPTCIYTPSSPPPLLPISASYFLWEMGTRLRCREVQLSGCSSWAFFYAGVMAGDQNRPHVRSGKRPEGWSSWRVAHGTRFGNNSAMGSSLVIGWIENVIGWSLVFDHSSCPRLSYIGMVVELLIISRVANNLLMIVVTIPYWPPPPKFVHLHTVSVTVTMGYLERQLRVFESCRRQRKGRSGGRDQAGVDRGGEQVGDRAEEGSL